MSNIIDPSHGISFVKNNTIYTFKSYTQLDSSNDKLGFVVNNTPHYLVLSNVGIGGVPAFTVIKNNQELLVGPAWVNISTAFYYNGQSKTAKNFVVGFNDNVTLTEESIFRFTFYDGGGLLGQKLVSLPAGESSMQFPSEISIATHATSFNYAVNIMTPFGAAIGSGTYASAGSSDWITQYLSYDFIESTPIT